VSFAPARGVSAALDVDSFASLAPLVAVRFEARARFGIRAQHCGRGLSFVVVVFVSFVAVVVSLVGVVLRPLRVSRERKFGFGTNRGDGEGILFRAPLNGTYTPHACSAILPAPFCPPMPGSTFKIVMRPAARGGCTSSTTRENSRALRLSGVALRANAILISRGAKEGKGEGGPNSQHRDDDDDVELERQRSFVRSFPKVTSREKRVRKVEPMAPAPNNKSLFSSSTVDLRHFEPKLCDISAANIDCGAVDEEAINFIPRSRRRESRTRASAAAAAATL